MRKMTVIALVLSAFVWLAGAQEQPQAKPDDALKNLVRVDKTQPVPEAMKVGFESINARDSVTMLSFISHDLLEGRETGTRGYRLAAEYAASLLSLWSVRPAGDQPRPAGRAGMFGSGDERAAQPAGRSFLQEFALEEVVSSSTAMKVEVRRGDKVTIRPFAPNIDFTLRASASETASAPVVFAGYGITEKGIGYDDLKGLEVKDKVILIISDAPGKNDPKSPFQQKELKEKYFPPPDPIRRYRGGYDKTEELAKLGPAAILMVQSSAKDNDSLLLQSPPDRVPDDRPIIDRQRRRMTLPGAPASNPWERSRVISITRETADIILEATGRTLDDLQAQVETTYRPASLVVPGTRLTVESKVETALVRASNVLGVIEGSDPVLKNEVVIVGAHLDHLGAWEKYVFNGADDNGSGSVGVLNIARAMALNPVKPKRTVVFALWAGEENGLLGSRYYVQSPSFPLDKTTVYFNLDMISRPYDERTLSRLGRMFGLPGGQDLLKKIKPSKFLPVSFSAGVGLDGILRAADQFVGLDVFLREASSSEGRMMGGSDHSSFARAQIPWVFSIAATTDDYHQPSDSVEKVSGDLMEAVSRLIYSAAYLAADR